MRSSSADERVLICSVWPPLFASDVAPEQPSCFSSPHPGHALGLGPAAGTRARLTSSLEAPVLLQDSWLWHLLLLPSPSPSMSWSWGCRRSLPGLALLCTVVPGCGSPSAACLGHFGLWRSSECGRRYRAEPSPFLQCHPSAMGHIPGWQLLVTAPSTLCCPISISSACRDDSAAFKDSWAAPKCGRSDRWSCSRWGEGVSSWSAEGSSSWGLHGVQGAAAPWSGCWVLRVTGASLALAESPVLAVKQEHN